MTRIFYIFMMSIVVMQAADDRVKLDASILASIPERRHAALLQYAIVIDDDHVDGSLEISEKTAQYIDTLKGFSQELMAAYYWHSDIPKDIDATIQLFQLVGFKEVAKIFFDSITLSDRRKGNYHELTINYFTLVFRKYAH